MNKRGVSELTQNVIAITLIVIFLATLIPYLQGVSSGKLIQSQVSAKQAALAIDEARPGTALAFSENLTFEGNRVISKKNTISFSYDHFNPNSGASGNGVRING